MKNETTEDKLPPYSGENMDSRQHSALPSPPRHQGQYIGGPYHQPQYDEPVPQEMTFLQRLIATSVIIAFVIFAKWVYMRMGK